MPLPMPQKPTSRYDAPTRRLLPVFCGIFFFFLCPPTPFAKPFFHYSQQARKVQQCMLQCDWPAAAAALDKMQASEPDNDIRILLEDQVEALQVGLYDRASAFKTYRKTAADRIYRISKGNPRSPYFLYAQAQIRVQTAVLEMRFGKYLSAASNASQAYALLKTCRLQHPGFVAADLASGMLEAAMGSLPEEYRWAADLLTGIPADVPGGLARIEKAAQAARTDPAYPFPEEALVVEALVHLGLNPHAEKAQQLSSRWNLEQSVLLRFGAALIASRSGHNDLALSLLGKKAPPFPYWQFLEGRCRLYRLEPAAEAPLQAFLATHQGNLGKAEAWQKLGWLRLIRGDEPGYRKAMQTILSLPGRRSDTDKAAFFEAESGETPHPGLLRARLLFDGGYLDQAAGCLQTLDAAAFKEKKQLAEYHYRKARVRQGLGQNADSAAAYLDCLAAGTEKNWYFLCNAALQLGYLYEADGRPDLARTYYRKCLAIKPDAYGASLHARAKAALNRL